MYSTIEQSLNMALEMYFIIIIIITASNYFFVGMWIRSVYTAWTHNRSGTLYVMSGSRPVAVAGPLNRRHLCPTNTMQTETTCSGIGCTSIWCSASVSIICMWACSVDNHTTSSRVYSVPPVASRSSSLPCSPVHCGTSWLCRVSSITPSRSFQLSSARTTSFSVQLLCRW